MKRLQNLGKKERKRLREVIRAVIQLLYFVFLPSAYATAFAGVKYIFTQIGMGEPLKLTSFVAVLIVLCVYTIVFGRFFCGFACAFGSLGDALHGIYRWVCKKRKKKPLQIPRNVAHCLGFGKYVILSVIVLLCFFGWYSSTQGMSPWDVFSMLHSLNFKLGKYIIGVVILLLLMIGMAVEERFFCKFFCPMGAIFSLLPVLPFFTLKRERKNCIKNCSACTRMCPSDIALPNAGSLEVSGDCFQCQKCINICPKGNVHCGIRALHGNEEYFTLLRAVILLALMIWLGV